MKLKELSMELIKRLACAVICCSASLSFAAQPTPQDIEKLMNVMNLDQLIQSTLKQIRPQLDLQAYTIIQTIVKHENLTPQEQIIANQLADKLYSQSQKTLAWDKLQPVYSKIYSDVFTAEEVKAQIDFYSSPAGHSTLQKSPLVAEKSMKIMNHQLAEIMQTTEQDFKEIDKKLNELRKQAN